MRTVEERNKLIEDNIKLVYYCFNRLNKDRFVLTYGDDLIQDGMVGLMKAADKYDNEKGRFSTFAMQCIRNEMFMSMRKMRKSFDKEISLYTPVGVDAEGAEVYLIDTIPCKNESDEGEIGCKNVIRFVKEQSDRSKTIMRMRYEGHTMTEIGKALGITQSYVSRLLRDLHRKYCESEGFNGN